MIFFLYTSYYLVLAFGIIAGIARFTMLDNSSKILAFLLAITITAEGTVALWKFVNFDKTVIYHFYSPFETLVLTAYFLEFLQIRRRRYLIMIIGCCYISLAYLNEQFLQPLPRSNSFFVSFESFIVIGLSLFALFKILINDSINSVMSYAHFWFWSIILFYFSATFFFWPCVHLLYATHSKYYMVARESQMIANILTYAGLGLVLFLYPKMVRNEP